MVIGFIFVLLVATVCVQIYAQASVTGGYTNAPDFPLASQIENYTADTNLMSQSLANGTSSTASTSTASNAFTGIGALSQAGSQAVSLTFASLGMMLSMIVSVQTAMAFIIPPWVFGFGLIFVSLMMVFAILAAVFKWWL